MQKDDLLAEPLGIECNCLTKTNNPDFHSHTCPVWLHDRLVKLRNATQSLLWDLTPCIEQHVLEPTREAVKATGVCKH